MGPRIALDVVEKGIFLASVGNQTHDFPAYSLVTVLTELSQLHYRGKFCCNFYLGCSEVRQDMQLQNVCIKVTGKLCQITANM